MTRNLRILAIAVAVSALTASGALAKEGPVLKVDVPFDFVVADQQLPSGEYSIATRADSGVVRICSTDQKHHVSLFDVPARSGVKAGGELEFHAHGTRRFLKSIRTAAGFGAHIPDSRSEKQAEASG